MKPLKDQQRLLLGPGPSAVHPAVLQAMATPLIGHLDPYLFELMDDIRGGLQAAFGTQNELTLPISGTGSAGMETILVNLLEPGDVAIIGVNGVFGGRLKEVAERCGATVIAVTAPWGQPLDPDDVAKSFATEKKVKMLAVVHAETSTGARQPLEKLAQIAHQHDALFVVDAVTSIAGIPILVDEVGIDASYAGTQKCLSAPPGLAPVTLNDRARDVIMKRKSAIQSWYLDLKMLSSYWGEERFYHHTAPISMIFALHEALRLIEEEGLENVYARHEQNGKLLKAELQRLDFHELPAESYRLPQLTTVKLPSTVQDGDVRNRLLTEYGIEIGGGLGPLKGEVWRIGLMGHSSSEENIHRLIQALKEIIGPR